MMYGRIITLKRMRYPKMPSARCHGPCKLRLPKGTHRNTRYCAKCKQEQVLKLKRECWHRNKEEYRRTYA